MGQSVLTYDKRVLSKYKYQPDLTAEREGSRVGSSPVLVNSSHHHAASAGKMRGEERNMFRAFGPWIPLAGSQKKRLDGEQCECSFTLACRSVILEGRLGHQGTAEGVEKVQVKCPPSATLHWLRGEAGKWPGFAMFFAWDGIAMECVRVFLGLCLFVSVCLCAGVIGPSTLQFHCFATQFGESAGLFLAKGNSRLRPFVTQSCQICALTCILAPRQVDKKSGVVLMVGQKLLTVTGRGLSSILLWIAWRCWG